MRVRLPLLLAMIALVASLTPAALAAAPRASLTNIENDVMCVSCRESLAVAQSPEAYQERSVIRRLIAEGLDKAQIEHQLVLQYGTAVLARPPAHGFNLTVYILPPAIIVLGLGVLAVYLPRWRRRSRTAVQAAGTPRLSQTDARRLEDELSRFGG